MSGESGGGAAGAPLALLDTNVLVCAYDADAGAKHDAALRLVARCWAGEERYALSLQNLSEFFVVVTRKVAHPLPADEAAAIVGDILAFPGWEVLVPGRETVLAAVRLSSAYRAPYWDALIAAAMLEHKVGRIVTEDVRGVSGIPGIEATDPFASG